MLCVQGNGDAVIDIEHDAVERKSARSSRAASLRQLWRRGRDAFNRTVAPEKVANHRLSERIFNLQSMTCMQMRPAIRKAVCMCIHVF